MNIQQNTSLGAQSRAMMSAFEIPGAKVKGTGF
jgi:hypothetical protein